jgi:DNA-binding transcriptional ArsR family regulator
MPIKQLERAAECLRTLSHPVRLQMIDLLLHGRYTVGALAEECGVQHHVASEHLRLMQHCQLLGREKEGRKTYYTIAEPGLASILHCIRNRFAYEESPQP